MSCRSLRRPRSRWVPTADFDTPSRSAVSAYDQPHPCTSHTTVRCLSDRRCIALTSAGSTDRSSTHVGGEGTTHVPDMPPGTPSRGSDPSSRRRTPSLLQRRHPRGRLAGGRQQPVAVSLGSLQRSSRSRRRSPPQLSQLTQPPSGPNAPHSNTASLPRTPQARCNLRSTWRLSPRGYSETTWRNSGMSTVPPNAEPTARTIRGSPRSTSGRLPPSLRTAPSKLLVNKATALGEMMNPIAILIHSRWKAPKGTKR
jgi:hypothetical protein